MSAAEPRLVIPEYDPYDHKVYLGDIKPGAYSQAQVIVMIEKNKDNPDVLQFLLDMLEE